jgi:hypothetical protein
MSFRPLLLTLPFLLLAAGSAHSQKSSYLPMIRAAAEKGWAENPAVIEQWKKTSTPSILWGYDAPANPVYLAGVFGFLYQQEGDNRDALRAARLLATYGELRSVLPKGFARTRAEYAQGVPPLSNFFYLPAFSRAYYGIRTCAAIDAATRATIERDLAETVEYNFRFPEWGAHNRALLRAEGMLYAALAMPHHPRAGAWRQMAEAIAADNLGHWEIEDASNYHPVWFHSLLSYAEAAGRADIPLSATVRYYLEYFTRLMCPTGTVPDYGDASWDNASGGLRFVAIFARGAAAFKSPEFAWAGQTILRSSLTRRGAPDVYAAYYLADAYRWTDDAVIPRPPVGGSQEVLEDVIGKKVVFRSGWDSTSTYLLLNYRDEGDGGWLDRAYLRSTISVEEEKMTHGHADENSVAMLMKGGSVLLHDAGYRNGFPSGPFGSWRQDYYHNRLVVRLNKRDARQGIMEFVRNSGAYRPVTTRKIDMVSLRDADMSRTRIDDPQLGYRADRTVVYLRTMECFVVIDAVEARRSEYFTFTTFWHGQSILDRGPHYYDLAYDSLPGVTLPRGQSLLVYFPLTVAKSDSVEPISRHGQTEQAVYQSIASQYKEGDREVFVSILVPHERTVRPSSLLRQFRVIPTSAGDGAVAVEVEHEGVTETVFVRLDLDRETARGNIRPRYVYDLGKVSFGAFETDAHFLHAVQSPDSLRYSCTSFLRLLYKGAPLIESLPNTFALQLDGAEPRVAFAKWRRWEGAVPLR